MKITHIVILFIQTVSLLNAQSHRGIQGIGTLAPKNEARIALVIGNSSYSNAPLRNPVNDSRLLASTLRKVGFEVIERENLKQAEMRLVIREFGKKIKHGGVGLFYYSGHGIQVKDQNYLIPIGANILKEEDVENESVELSRVTSEYNAADNSLNILILDACRNNPFARSFRGALQGLAQISASKGTLIAYSTAPGSVAADGDGENSPYTEELVNAIQTPGLELNEVFKIVRSAVRIKTDEMQLPWEATSLEGNFYFIGPVIHKDNFQPQGQSDYSDSGLKDVINIIDSKTGVELIFIPGGTFQMGDLFSDGEAEEKPVHTVTLSDFYIGKTEVTVAQYRAFCTATGRSMPLEPTEGWKDDHPIVNITWGDAKAFCDWGNYRLPTEAEWEYAAREGGKMVRFGNGKNSASSEEINFNAEKNEDSPNSIGGIVRGFTTPVAAFQPNVLGLYDMSGNVWEWCSDWFGKFSGELLTNPQGPNSGLYRVMRGGSWFYNSWYCRTSVRGWGDPDGFINNCGFRVAKK